MPAPWTGGTTADVSIYTPPGYDPHGNLLYPVLYEAPTSLALWSSDGANALAVWGAQLVINGIW